MDPNQNPPSDPFAGMVSNAPMKDGLAPITLSGLLEMKEKCDALWKEMGPIKFKDGADMSPETFQAISSALGITMYSKDGGHTFFDPHINPITSIEIHLIPGMEFGDVQECQCKKAKGQVS